MKMHCGLVTKKLQKKQNIASMKLLRETLF